MKVDVPLLKKICEAPGAPGFEEKIRNIVLKEVESHVDKLTVDNMGSIVAYKKGKDSSKKVITLLNS